jgi:GAF domain-containing protein
MLAPIIRDGRLAGIISVHHVRGPQRWTEQQVEALRRAEARVRDRLEEDERRSLPGSAADLRDAAIDAILNALREALSVHRCTLRQDVLERYAFAVTHESRREDVRSLKGDFTIVQTGQPVIEKLLSERLQVVQDDSRNASSDPAFQTALDHYGGMGAQIVTPLFGGDGLTAVLSVHYLNGPRKWSRDETELAEAGTRLIGGLLDVAPVAVEN